MNFEAVLAKALRVTGYFGLTTRPTGIDRAAACFTYTHTHIYILILLHVSYIVSSFMCLMFFMLYVCLLTEIALVNYVSFK